jgi:hypothetical protein
VPLTSVRLILLAALLTAAALATTVLVWRRRWVLVTRPAGVLLTEALLTLTVGLVVNRSQLFYPSWAALFAGSDPGPSSYHTRAGRLDAWLAAQPGAGSAQSFRWRPPGWTAWHLAAAPEVTVPAGYLAHSGWRYSAVLVIAARAWPVPSLTGPTVLVSVTTTAATAASTLAVSLPGLLGRDLRVTGHRWALVTSAADGALARKAATAGRGRFPTLAFVGVSAPAHALVVRPTAPAAANSCPVVHRTVSIKPADPTHPVHGVGTNTAPGYDKSAPAVHSSAPPATGGAVRSCASPTLPPGVLPAGIHTAYFPGAGTKTGPLRATLTWAASQTPLPLAASAPEPTYLPPAPPKHPHHKVPVGGIHGSGQPRP